MAAYFRGTTGTFVFEVPYPVAKIWRYDPFAEPKRPNNRAEYLVMKIEKWRSKHDR